MSKTAFIFPGQGSQKAGMGKDFYERYPKAAEIYDMASDFLKLDMKALCFEENDKLDLTEYTQAALVTTCLAMERVLADAGVKADITAGLSLGEYCAIHVAGGMSAADAIRTVRERGILMQDTVPAGEGGMALCWAWTRRPLRKDCRALREPGLPITTVLGRLSSPAKRLLWIRRRRC